jgi:hypothetical protein
MRQLFPRAGTFVAKKCRERWKNHLNPTLIKGNWSKEEDGLIIRLQKEIGNKWSEIASHLPARTEHSVKNRFYSLARANSKDDSTQQSSDEASAELGSKDSPKIDDSKTILWWPPFFPK